MRLYCFYCGKSVTNEIPDGVIFRAIATCPECTEKDRPSSARSEGEAVGYKKALDDVIEVLTTERGDKYGKLAYIVTIPIILEEMKREYDQLKTAHGGGEHGKTE